MKSPQSKALSALKRISDNATPYLNDDDCTSMSLNV